MTKFNRTPRPDQLDTTQINLPTISYWQGGVMVTAQMPAAEARSRVEEGKAFVISPGHIGALNENGEYDS